jgi:tetratricopeptide (TPR) repeat protein
MAGAVVIRPSIILIEVHRHARKRFISTAAACSVLVPALCLGLYGCGNEPDSPSHGEGGAIAPAPAVSAANIEQALAAADDYLNREELAKAEAILSVLIERAPRELRARELMGQVLTAKATEADQRGDEETAAAARRDAWAHYRVAVELDPDSAGLQHSTAMIALAAGASDAALEHFRAAGRLDPTNPQHPLYEAQLLIQRQDYVVASEAVDRVLALDPDEPFAHASRAIIAMEEGRLSEAVHHITEARRISPSELGFRVQHARIHRRLGDPRSAVELLAPLTDLERADEGVTNELAAAYGDLGEHAKAAAAWAHRYASQPESRRMYLSAVRAGESLVMASRLEEARQWLAEAERLAPSAPEVEALRRALAEAGRPKG